MTHSVFEIAQLERRGHTEMTKRQNTIISMWSLHTTLPVMSCSTCYHQSLKKQKRRTLGNATVGRLISLFCDSCVMMSFNQTSDLTNTMQCELIISSCDRASERKRKRRGKKKATCVINGDGAASPQPPVSRRGRAAVPHHTGVLVPAWARRLTGWHVSRGGALMCVCVCVWAEMFARGKRKTTTKKKRTKNSLSCKVVLGHIKGCFLSQAIIRV